jgi:hypothetical protein
MRWRGRDQLILWTAGDHLGPLLPVLDRCDTDPARTEGCLAAPITYTRSCSRRSFAASS